MGPLMQIDCPLAANGSLSDWQGMLVGGVKQAPFPAIPLPHTGLATFEVALRSS